jgi:hypothetical protein
MIAGANRAALGRREWLVLAGMAVGLALFSRIEALPVRLPALALFGLLALLRPDLMLLFVPFTAPMYLIGVLILGLRAGETRLPLHEIALLLCLAATSARAALGWLLAFRPPTKDEGRRTEDEGRRAKGERPKDPEQRPTALPLYRSTVVPLYRCTARHAPQGLFLLAGLGGVLLAVERGPALIELRRLIVEPLIFFFLLRWHLRRGLTLQAVAGAFVAGGALAALIGLLQVAGVDLIWMFGDKATVGAAENLVEVGGVRRATSFYGHPNNLGLGLGRVWPLAAALALAAWRAGSRRLAWLYGLAALLCAAGLAVSFSRGAWLGAVAAAAALGLGLLLLPANDQQPLTKDERRRTKDERPEVSQAPSTTSGASLQDLRHRRASAASAFPSPTQEDERPTTNDQGRTAKDEWLGDHQTSSPASGASLQDLRHLRASAASAFPSPTPEASGPGRTRLAIWAAGLGVALALVVGLGLALRGGPGGGSGAARLLIWREALGYIRLHPLGLGLDQFLYYHNPQYGRSLADPILLRPENRSELFAAHPHNMLLDTWLRVGPLGLLAFGWLLVRYVRAGLRAMRGPAAPALVALGALAALAAALTHGLVDNFYFVGDLALAFWMLLALVERAAEEAGPADEEPAPAAALLAQARP